YYRPALPAKLLKLKQHLSNRICERKYDLITSLKLIHNELLHIGKTKFKNCRPFKQREDVLTTSTHSQFDTSSNVCNLINLQNKSGFGFNLIHLLSNFHSTFERIVSDEKKI
ncbi:hypothetical protein DMUE_6220, partial [Dictyocoela muelleri]